MASKYKYHMIKNFTTNGDLGISTKCINEIVKIAVLEIEGVAMQKSHTVFFERDVVSCRFSPLGDLSININILVKYGYNVEEVCRKIQEKVENIVLYTTEIKPKKIHISVDEVAKS